ncbi:MAG: Asp-tRNA(Asn)/Glu-tRNA(Gln) amidotransferase subunit GatA [Clostridiales bacterium]|nr:Asp-tRNA(Asn)/Glu-tRNA(Gln) amidotransferase subunit GatA [Clostridiales bacterium]
MSNIHSEKTEEILSLTLIEAGRRIRSGALSAVEAVGAAFARIGATAGLNTFITLDEAGAYRAAAAVDARLARGETVGALAGIPVAVKDNLSTKGLRTTCASRFLENYVPPFDAAVVERLRDADAVIVGKLNMDEFAMGSSNETSYFGPVLNPADETRVAGGSSGGSAAAVAARQVFGSLGTDTGGSIRQPAAYCGAVGLKPTYSAVSRFGAVAFASSLDQVGPLTRTVADNAALFSVIAGHDRRDATSAPDYQFLGYPRWESLKGRRVGVVKEFFGAGLSAGVRERIERALAVFESLGASPVEVSIKTFDAALATYYILSCAEAASNLARFDGIKYGCRADADGLSDLYYRTRTEGFGAEVKRRIMMGNYVLSSGYYDAYYLKASKLRTLIKADFDRAFSVCEILAGPTAPTTAFPVGRRVSDPAENYLTDVYTVPVNIAGLPALSVPCGRDGGGLPVGLQLIAPARAEDRLFSFAQCFEDETGGGERL